MRLSPITSTLCLNTNYFEITFNIGDFEGTVYNRTLNEVFDILEDLATPSKWWHFIKPSGEILIWDQSGRNILYRVIFKPSKSINKFSVTSW